MTWQCQGGIAASHGRKLTRRPSARIRMEELYCKYCKFNLPTDTSSIAGTVVSPAASAMQMHSAQFAHRDDREGCVERQTEPSMQSDLARVNRKFHE